MRGTAQPHSEYHDAVQPGAIGNLSRPHHRRDKDIIGHFPDPVVQLIVETDLQLIDHYDPIIKKLDKQILSLANVRLVKGQKSSAGKNYGTTGGRTGNAHLRWAFSEATVLFLRHTKPGTWQNRY